MSERNENHVPLQSLSPCTYVRADTLALSRTQASGEERETKGDDQGTGRENISLK